MAPLSFYASAFIETILNMIRTLYRLITFQYSKPLYTFKGEFFTTTIGKYPTEYMKIPHRRRDQPSDTQESKTQTESSEEELTIVLVPGNPGHVRFYDVYLSALAAELNYRHTIYAIGHVGHSKYANQSESNRLLNSSSTSSILTEQINHKVEFMNFLMKEHKNSKFVFLSHSIGSYIVLNMLERLPRNRIHHSYKLFPTIEEMNAVPNYFSANISTSFPCRFLLASVASLISKVLPTSVQRAIVHLAVTQPCAEQEPLEDIVETVLGFLDFSTVINLAKMAQDEFKVVRERQNKLLNQFLDVTTLYYGVSDGWAPLRLQKQLVADIPKAKTIVDTAKLEHAFVVGGARQMASITAAWIN